MSSRFRKIFLGACVIVPFLIYCVYYYGMVFKNAPYRFAEFDSFTFQYGHGDSLINKYNSKTGDYQFIDTHDSLVKINLHLPKTELLYLHQKAAQLGFWDFPSDERGDTSLRRDGQRPPRYVIEFKYKHKSKKVIYDANYAGPQKLLDANQQMIKEIIKVLDAVESKEEERK